MTFYHLLILLCLIIGVATSIIELRNHYRFINKCTETTKGKIIDIDEEIHRRGKHTYTTKFFKIEYKANQKPCLLRQAFWHCAEPGRYICGSVVVHYDPNDPNEAWAETPGKHKYSIFL
ncbi:MAG: hypothetical protein IJ181_11330 [Acidaminococcaceae bacterium]|nr:hypothetical protein [Acidaminococcaceae bacterium]